MSFEDFVEAMGEVRRLASGPCVVCEVEVGEVDRLTVVSRAVAEEWGRVVELPGGPTAMDAVPLDRVELCHGIGSECWGEAREDHAIAWMYGY